jgi:hypothetical protein
MKPALLILTIAAVASSAAVGAETEKAKAYELKNRSVFNADLEGRIPFWPLGFVRPKAGVAVTYAAAPAAKIRLEPGHFSVTSILLGNPPLATINGRSFEEGELLPVIWGTERLRVVVRTIRDGGVTLEYEDQQILVPMRRQEIGQKHQQQQRDAAEFVIKLGPTVTK